MLAANGRLTNVQVEQILETGNSSVRLR